MKKGSIILGAAAFGATILSAFAFKSSNPTKSKLFVSFVTTAGGKKCAQCSAWTKAGTGRLTAPSCKTTGGNFVAIPGGASHRTLYTQKTSVNNHCSGAKARYTLTF